MGHACGILQSTGRQLRRAQRVTAHSEAGSAQGPSLLRTWAVLALVPTPSSDKAGSRQSFRLSRAGSGPCGGGCRIPPSLSWSWRQIPSSPLIPAPPELWGFRTVGTREACGPVLHSTPHRPPTKPHLLRGLKSPEQGLHKWSCPSSLPHGPERDGGSGGFHRRVHRTSLGSNKDSTQQGSIASAWVQGSDSLHALPFPPSPSTEAFRQGRQHRAARRSRLEDPSLGMLWRSTSLLVPPLLLWELPSWGSATWSSSASRQERGCVTQGLVSKRNPPQGPSLGRTGLSAVNTK